MHFQGELATTTTEPMKMSLPSLDICDTDKEIIAHLEVPGMSRDDLSLEVADGLLTIRGTKLWIAWTSV
jgi:HSP20 family protein